MIHSIDKDVIYLIVESLKASVLGGRDVKSLLYKYSRYFAK